MKTLFLLTVSTFLLSLPAHAEKVTFTCPSSNTINIRVRTEFDVRVDREWDVSTYGGADRWVSTEFQMIELVRGDDRQPPTFICTYDGFGGRVTLRRELPAREGFTQCFIDPNDFLSSKYVCGASNRAPRPSQAEISCLMELKDGPKYDFKGLKLIPHWRIWWDVRWASDLTARRIHCFR